MRGLPLFVAAILTLSFAAHAEDAFKVSGYVTAVRPSGDFDAEGFHVRLTPTTEFRTPTIHSPATDPASRPAAFFLGEPLEAKGKLDRATHTITATRIVLILVTPASVTGVAIIDLIPPPPADQAASDRTLRADGFLIRITEKTKLKFAPPLASISDIATNQWIDYSGVQQLDGTVVLTYAGIGPNKVATKEDYLRTKTDYNPAAVPDDSHQSGISKAFVGVDARRLPPHHDQDMQARVERIGKSLIPAYQRALPDSDPTKIPFRFQVIDDAAAHDAHTMPSGVIVVPYQVVERMQNDDQLAAVLADNIAEAFEKEGLRSLTAANVKAIGKDAAVLGVVVLGPAELVGGLAAEHYANKAIDRTLQQSGRVSLWLLHDAGYDITQAPVAWWLLAPKSAKSFDEIKTPPRADTLYIALGTTWHPIADPPKLP